MGYSYDSYEAYGYYYSLITLVEKIIRHVNEITTAKGREREERERERERMMAVRASLEEFMDQKS